MLQSKRRILDHIRRRVNDFVDRAPVKGEARTRLYHYTVFFAIGLPTMVVFGAINLLRGNWLLFSLILLCGSSLCIGLLALGRLKNGRVVYRLNCFLFGFLVGYLVILGGEGGSKILWAYPFPLIAFFLFGKREGLIWSGLILLFAIVCFWGPLAEFVQFVYTAAFKVRFVATYLIVSAITYWFEYARVYYRLKLEEQNQALEREKANLYQEIRARQQLEHELRRLASTDCLTGAANRRQFMDLAQKEFSRCKRYGHHMAILMLDIDHFKSINDTHGHPVGDDVLKALVNCCAFCLRESDLVGRIGGEEFAILLVEAEPDGAQLVADRLRLKIADIQLPVVGEHLKVTVSIGITNVCEVDESLEIVLKRADDALYRAKNTGRDRVVKR